MKKNIWYKIGELFGSVRFWLITIGVIITGIKMAQAGNLDIIGLLTLIQGYIGTVAGVGMVDKIAEKVGGSSANK